MIPRVKRLLLGVLVGSMALAALLWLLTKTLGLHETRYQGQPLDYWLSQADAQGTGLSNAASAVIETEIIPALSRSMFADTNDSSVRLFLIDQLNALPGVTIRFITCDSRRAEAAESLGQLGLHAKAAVPDLIRAIKATDRAVRPAAAKALGEIKSDAATVIPLLVALLDDPQDGVPEGAAHSLGRFGQQSAAAVPKLLELLKIQDKDLQQAVRTALKQIDPAEAAKVGIN